MKDFPESVRERVLHGFGNPDKSTVPPTSHVAPPKILYSRDADYTDEARRNRINGSCEFEVELDETGKIKTLWLTAPLGYGLDAAAENAIDSYQFAPAKRDGVPVSASIFINVGFSR